MCLFFFFFSHYISQFFYILFPLFLACFQSLVVFPNGVLSSIHYPPLSRYIYIFEGIASELNGVMWKFCGVCPLFYFVCGCIVGLGSVRFVFYYYYYRLDLDFIGGCFLILLFSTSIIHCIFLLFLSFPLLYLFFNSRK